MGKPRKVATTIDRMQEILGSLPEDEMNDLAESINEGWLPGSAVLVDAETGKIIDGHQRAAAYKQATGKELPKAKMKKVAVATPDEAAKMIVAANLRRRHLTRDRRAELHAFLADDMGWSVRRIAAETGTPKSTVQDDIERVEDAVRDRTPDDTSVRRNFQDVMDEIESGTLSMDGDEEPTKRTGLNGKTYTKKARSPKTEKVERPRTLGSIIKSIDAALDVIDEGMSAFAQKCRDGDAIESDIAKAQHAWRHSLNLALELLDEVAPE